MFIHYASSDLRFFLAVIVTVIVSICLHELAHGVVAIGLGDRTPIESGHMTLNPAVHMGLFSVICLLLAGIAWGSMPVDPRRLRGRFSPALVAAAGPAANVLLALAALVSLGVWQRLDLRRGDELSIPLANLQYLLRVFGTTNFMLAIFNLIPIPPLDGSRIAANFSGAYSRLMSGLSMTGGLMVLFLLVFMFAGRVIIPLAASLAESVLQFARG